MALINDEIGAHISGQVFVIYDDKHVDEQHADRIAAEVPVQRTVTPHAGHPAIYFLHRAEILKPLMLNLIRGRCEEGTIRSLVRTARRMSARHLCSLARHGRFLRRRLRLLDQAQSLEPHRLEIHTVRGQIHDRSGNLVAAAEAFRHALAVNPGHGWAKVWLADVLSRSGDHAQAIAYAAEATIALPGLAEFHHFLGMCLFRSMDSGPAARDAFEAAAWLDPDCARYRQSH